MFIKFKEENLELFKEQMIKKSIVCIKIDYSKSRSEIMLAMVSEVNHTDDNGMYILLNTFGSDEEIALDEEDIQVSIRVHSDLFKLWENGELKAGDCFKYLEDNELENILIIKECDGELYFEKTYQDGINSIDLEMINYGDYNVLPLIKLGQPL